MENKTSLKVLSEETNKDFNLNNLKKLDKNTNLVKPARESGLELLRIIAMLFILMHHAVMFSGINASSVLESKIFDILQIGGKLGVNLFVLISAYFMVNKSFKLSRILKIIFETFFYSVFIYLIFIAFGKTNFTIDEFILNFFPVIFERWWFVTTFVLLMILSPFLNIIIKSVSKNLLLVISIVLFAYGVGVNEILLKVGNYLGVGLTSYMNKLLWFVTLYFVASYIRLYNINLNKILNIILIFCVWIFRVLFTVYSKREIWFEWAIGNAIMSILLLLFFKNLKFRNKYINLIALTTFGIYLIHENVYIRGLWGSIVKLFYSFLGSYILTFLLVVLLVFIICMVIDLIRINTVHRLTKKLLVKIDKIEEKIKVKYQEKENGK